MAYLDNTTRDRYLEYTKSRVTEKRFLHTLGTEKMAIAIAENCGANIAAVQTAAILHDAFKCISKEEKRILASKYNINEKEIAENNPDLLHGPIAAEAVKADLGIEDADILNAIRWHTTGRANMTELEKIIYLADMIEPNRKPYPGLEPLREICMRNLDQAMHTALRMSLEHVMEQGKTLHPDTLAALKTYEPEQTV